MTPQKVADLRTDINWLKDNLTAEKFAQFKNVRNVTEFTRLGNATTMLDNSALSPDAITGEAGRLYGNSQRTQANIIAASGRPVPYNLAGLADPIYLNKNSPWYQGAYEEPPPQGEQASPQPQGPVGQPAPTHRFNPATGKVESF